MEAAREAGLIPEPATGRHSVGAGALEVSQDELYLYQLEPWSPAPAHEETEVCQAVERCTLTCGLLRTLTLYSISPPGWQVSIPLGGTRH